MRKIIIQERINEPSDFSFRFVFWAVVPIARQSAYADPAKTSVIKDITAQELADLRAGVFVERQDTANYISGTPIATIQADLITKFNIYQTQVNAANPWKYYGTVWDGSAWVVSTIN